ncbi:MAG: SIMPL domain-containing protein [Bacteroidota bacterium]|nr:SIMPL domain-containing protein [Bacteroidota bacterium]
MKNTIATIALIFTFITGISQTKNFIDQPYLEVNGSADTLVIPDEIYISIMISENDTKNRISVEEMEIKMVNALKSLGIDTEKDLVTNDISSSFRYYIFKSKDILKSKQYVLKVKNALTATKVAIALEDVGISNTSIDRVDYSEKENIKNLMLTKAIENAKTRANAMVKPLNQTIGAVIYIADNKNNNDNNNNLFTESLQEVKVTGILLKIHCTRINCQL